MIKEKLGPRLDGWIHAAFPFLFWRELNPNALTLFGTAISLLAGFAFARGAFLEAGLLLLFGGFFDLTDGVVARHFGRSSSFGAFLDSTMDRVADMAAMLGLVVWYGTRDDGVPQLLAAVVLMASILTSYVKARAELTIEHLPGGMLERGERVGILAAGALFGLMEPALWVLAAGTTITVFQRIAAAHREMERLDGAER